MPAPQQIWPSHQGDHRAAWHSAFNGAVHGRIRWRFAHQNLYSPLVSQEKIFTQSEEVVFVLNQEGQLQSTLRLPSKAWEVRFVMGDCLIALQEDRLLSLSFDGRLLWEKPVEGRLVASHLSPSGKLVLWVMPSEWSLEQSGTLYCFDEDGKLLWSAPQQVTLVGYPLGTKLAFDDEGALYVLALGRMGDGVSGSDVATGGFAAYDTEGRLLWQREAGRSLFREVYGLASGAIFSGLTKEAYSADGALTQTIQEAAAFTPEEGLSLRLYDHPEHPQVLFQTGPNSSAVLSSTRDGKGIRFFTRLLWAPPRVDCLFSLRPELSLGFRLGLSGEPFRLRSPVVGPKESILIPDGGELLCIE